MAEKGDYSVKYYGKYAISSTDPRIRGSVNATKQARELESGLKTCSKCGEIKTLDNYKRAIYFKGNNLSPQCNDCRLKYRQGYQKDNFEKLRTQERESRLKRQYNMSQDDFDRKLLDQDGLCAICGKELEAGFDTHIDHSHKTGQIRGLLCQKCNRGLGHFNDNDDLLYSAITYLNYWNKFKSGDKNAEN